MDSRSHLNAAILFFPPLSSLFPDVVNCMQTDNLELKKLVYLYLMNYAKSQPDLAILAVNTFAKVCLVPLVDWSLVPEEAMNLTASFHLFLMHSQSPLLPLPTGLR